MSAQVVRSCIFDAPPVDRREIFRYMGGRGAADAATDALIGSVIDEAMPRLSYRVCWSEAVVTRAVRGVMLGTVMAEGESLARHLQDSTRALLFAATVGLEIDRMVAKYSHCEPSRALALQAFGAERVEALCEAFLRERCEEYNTLGVSLLPRFSPGYGDLPLEVQRELIAILDCPRKIGLSLCDSLLMTPTKSVTAIVGLITRENEC